jgi:hypothetical protein
MDRAHDVEATEAPVPAPASASALATVGPAGLTRANLLALQRVAGNRGVGRVLARLTGETFTNAKIQAHYAAFTGTVTDAQKKALHKLDDSLTGVWTKLNWDDVAASTAARVLKPTIIDQKLLGVCGPAAALQEDAQNNAEDYVALVRECFASGTVHGSRKVNDTLLGLAPHNNMDPSDWMMLSAIQDKANYVRDFKGVPTTDSDPWYNKRGLDREGTKSGNQAWILRTVNHCVEVIEYTCSMWGEVAETTTVSDLMRKHGTDVVVLVENDGGYLDNDGTGAGDGHANHWVRLMGPVNFKDGKAEFTVFTWGKTLTLSWDLAKFKKWVYGYQVGSKKLGVLVSYDMTGD